MTVEELYNELLYQIAIWNSKKVIYISQDDEWNDFHLLLQWFIYKRDEVEANLEEYRIQDIERHHELKDIVLLW